MMSDTAEARLLRLLPEIPRWVEVRGALLSGRCEVIELDEHGGFSFVARESAATEERGVFLSGEPDPELVHAAIGQDRDCMVIVPQESEHFARATLPGWTASRAILHTLPSDDALPALCPDDDLRTFNADDLDLIRDEMPSDLGPWLRKVVELDGSQIAFWADGKPVSFCCSLDPSERYWDVAVDTLPRWQRRGYAGKCAAWMIREMRRTGREPIWGAEESNAQSMGLARKLGFVPVDVLYLLTPPDAG